jgi:hypothetical protein
MRNARRKASRENIRFHTMMAARMGEESVERANAFEADADQGLRVQAMECRTCFYIKSSRVGGAAMTTWECGVCAKPDIHGSTATPVVCDACAKEYDLCRNCGGDLNMDMSRSHFPEIVESTSLSERRLP